MVGVAFAGCLVAFILLLLLFGVAGLLACWLVFFCCDWCGFVCLLLFVVLYSLLLGWVGLVVIVWVCVLFDLMFCGFVLIGCFICCLFCCAF